MKQKLQFYQLINARTLSIVLGMVQKSFGWRSIDQFLWIRNNFGSSLTDEILNNSRLSHTCENVNFVIFYRFCIR